MEGHLQQILGRNVRMIRVERDLSQKKFAELLGMQRSYLWGIEQGKRNLALGTLERFAVQLGAVQLGVDPVDLLIDHQPVLPPAPDGGAPLDAGEILTLPRPPSS